MTGHLVLASSIHIGGWKWAGNFTTLDLIAAGTNALNGALLARRPDHYKNFTVVGIEPPRIRWRLRFFGFRNDYSVPLTGLARHSHIPLAGYPAGRVESVFVVPGHPFRCRHGHLPGVLPRPLVIEELLLVKRIHRLRCRIVIGIAFAPTDRTAPISSSTAAAIQWLAWGNPG